MKTYSSFAAAPPAVTAAAGRVIPTDGYQEAHDSDSKYDIESPLHAF